MCFKAEKMISILPPPPPPPKVQIWIRGQGKNDTFFIDRKEKNKKGRREKREEGKKRGKKGRKKEGKKGGKKECKCVFRLKK